MQKTRKHFDGEQEKSMALINRLPEDILIRILSFTSTRQCVRSSILGKRWRFLWARVPNLNFESRDHKTVTSFIIFFNRFVFFHRGHNINTFSIAFENDDKEGSECKIEIETLIATAIACNVQIIEFYSRLRLMLPHCIFTCKTLVDLALFDLTLVDLTPIRFCENNIPMTSKAVYLPVLKKLTLVRIRHESEESLVHLLSGCPALEELDVLKEDTNLVCFYVSSPTLTRLDLQIPKEYENVKVFEVKLDTPALKYLSLRDNLSRDFSAGMLASLTEADFVFDAQAEWDVLYSRSVLEFVGKMNNASSLKVTTGLMNVPDSTFSALTIEFRNLTKLQLTGDWRFVTTFLDNSDNLEVLSIFMDYKPQYWMEPKQVPLCLTYHLRTFKFFNFKCSEPEFDMVEYILKNAKVLKGMEIIYFSNSHRHLKKKYGALRRISLFERASEACRVAFD